jgi:N-acetyl-gamma-glutamyl-phosphate reductase
MLSIGIIGATGYTGLELVRLLLHHPEVKISVLTSEKSAGKKFSEVFPSFQGKIDLILEPLNPEAIAPKVKCVFLCLPHQQAMDAAKAFLQKKIPVIDLSADFRLSAAEVYEAWYGPHRCHELLKEAVYGLPELHREQIKKASLVANPGCYPTSCILGLAPLIKNKFIDLATIHCDSKSGVSGAGRNVEATNLFCEVNEGLKAYKVGVHRHTPEIEQEISRLAGENVVVSFTPHLVPMNRGILSTLYASVKKKLDAPALHRIYQDFYGKEPFVRVRPLGSFPGTQDVCMTNYCDIGVHLDERTGRCVIVSALDNLVKGASGQAVQNMNLMHGMAETAGLSYVAPYPG